MTQLLAILLIASCNGCDPLILRDASVEDADAASEDTAVPDADGDADADAEHEAGNENRAPEAIISVTPDGGLAPLMVTLDGSASSDPEGDTLTYRWSIESGETFEGPVVETELTFPGCMRITLTVVDSDGLEDQAEAVAVVTSSLPGGDPVVTYDVLPQHQQVYPRDLATNLGVVEVIGAVESDGYERIGIRLFVEDVTIAEA